MAENDKKELTPPTVVVTFITYLLQEAKDIKYGDADIKIKMEVHDGLIKQIELLKVGKLFKFR